MTIIIHQLNTNNINNWNDKSVCVRCCYWLESVLLRFLWVLNGLRWHKMILMKIWNFISGSASSFTPHAINTWLDLFKKKTFVFHINTLESAESLTSYYVICTTYTCSCICKSFADLFCRFSSSVCLHGFLSFFFFLYELSGLQNHYIIW